MEVGGARQKGDGGGVALWSHLIFLVWGGGTTKQQKNQKTKKQKMKKQQLGMKMAWLCLPSPLPPWPAPLACVPHCAPSPAPRRGLGQGPQLGAAGGQGG